MGEEFVSVEALGGIVLLVATAAALVWANAAHHGYEDLWNRVLTIGIGDASVSLSLREWVASGLMTVFFFVVGLEIKRELVRGELRDPRAASLPVMAAVGGMVVPALVYLAWNAGGPGVRGWGIPMATDIAFAVGVLALFGSRVPTGLKLFVLTAAIVDDIGAIVVIAIFYSGGVDAAWLGGAVGVVATVVTMQRLHVGHPLAYVLPAVGLWVCVHESGVHATIAGVVLGLLTPVAPAGREVLETLEHRVHPWSSFAVVPLFALASAGVLVTAASLQTAATSDITWGIVTGLVLGKLLGVTVATLVGVRLGIGRLPSGVSVRHVVAAGAIAGIGFTVALFIGSLSFGTDARYQEAVIGILGASLVAGCLGAATLLTLPRREEPTA